MGKIEMMTPQQEVAMLEYREAIRLRGISTERADRQQITEAIATMYRRLGKPMPTVWIADGPVQAHIWMAVFKKYGLPWTALGDNLADNLAANLAANLADNLAANLAANLRANLGDNLWDNLRANLAANLRDNLWANLRDNRGPT